jgi:outer membrane protein TolC
MRSQLYEAQQQLLSQKSSLLASRFGFNQVRNRPTEEVCRLETLTIERDGFVFSSEVVADAIYEEEGASALRDFLVALGLKRSPVLRSLDAQIRADWRTMKSGRRWLIPSLDAIALGAVFVKTGGEGSANAQDGSLFWQLGLKLNWNVLEGGAYIATMNQSKAEFWSLEFQRTNTATALEEDIRATAATAMVSFEQIALAALQSKAANENYALVSEQYLDGESPLLNLIDAQEELIEANSSARQALYQFLSDLLTLEQSIAYYPFFEADADALVRDLENELR